MLLLLGSRKNIEKRIVEEVKALRDLIEITSKERLSPQAIRETLRRISENVSKLPDSERNKLARNIDDLFEEKIAILRSWKENNVRKIRSMLKELKLSKKVPQTKLSRIKMLDSQTKLYEAQLMLLENLRDIIVDTVQRGVDPVTAWEKVMSSSAVVSEFVETITEHAEAFEELVKETAPTEVLEELEEEYGVKEPEEVAKKELQKLMEKYGVEE